MASPITFGGLASGLDTKAIVSALVAVEGRKVEFLQSQKIGFNAKIGAYNDLLSRLNKLQEALDKLADADEFLAYEARLPDGAEDFVTVTPGGSAKAGSYELEISAIAESSFIRSDGFADGNQDLGITGDLKLQVGTTTTTIAIDGTNATLFGVRDAINTSGAEVLATVVFDGTDYHLELRGKETGVANAVTILEEPSQPPPLGPVLNLATQRAASDAVFKVDGQDYTSASNSVSTAIQGVTLQLVAAQGAGAAPITLTIAENFEEIEGQLNDFVSAYNGVIDFIAAQNRPRENPEDPMNPLNGESALRSLRGAFSDVLGSMTQNVNTQFKSLASLGIRTQSDGKLKLDAEDLKTALGTDLDGVVALFSDAVEGVAVRLTDAVKDRTDIVSGVIKLRNEALQTSITTLDRRIRAAEDALERFETNLIRRFAQYETLIGRLQSQGSSLGALGTLGAPNG